MTLTHCPTCGHSMSAYAGSCTGGVVIDGLLVACGHDCSVDYDGESLNDQFKRALQRVFDNDARKKQLKEEHP
jgi:hypothetical protein